MYKFSYVGALSYRPTIVSINLDGDILNEIVPEVIHSGSLPELEAEYGNIMQGSINASHSDRGWHYSISFWIERADGSNAIIAYHDEKQHSCIGHAIKQCIEDQLGSASIWRYDTRLDVLIDRMVRDFRTYVTEKLQVSYNNFSF